MVVVVEVVALVEALMCVLCRRGVWSRTAHTAMAATLDTTLALSRPAATLHANGRLVNCRVHQIPGARKTTGATF